MERGFSVISKNGQIVKSKNELNANDIVEIKFTDGVKTAKIMEE